jgi:hypothetical protein
MAKYVVIYGCFKHGLKAAGPYPSLEQAVVASNHHIDANAVADVLTLDESGVPEAPPSPPSPPSPKFRLGDEVWLILDNRLAAKVEIDGVHQFMKGGQIVVEYTTPHPRKEGELFATKQDLLESL